MIFSFCRADFIVAFLSSLFIAAFLSSLLENKSVNVVRSGSSCSVISGVVHFSYFSAMVAQRFSLFLQISFCCFLHSVQVEVPHLVCPILPYQNSHIVLMKVNSF